MVTKRFNFSGELLEFGEVNSGFARIKLGVMTYEQIANGTHFSKEVIDKRISGLNYLPVVMEYKAEKQDAGTHGGKIEISDDGIEFIDTTKPYGVVIANTAKWEDVKQKNGETIKYLTVEAYVWLDRYPELQCLYDGKQNNQSMEVKVLDSEFDENRWILEILDFEFSALCILGSDVQPAFDEAKVSVDYSKNDFKADYSEMINALNIYLQNNNMEVFNLDNEKLDIETTEEFEETQDETLDTETVDEFEEETDTTETDDIDKIEEVVEEEKEDEFTEEVENVEEESVDYEKLYKDLLVEYDSLVEQNKELNNSLNDYEKAEKELIFEAFSDRLTSDEMQPIVDKIDELSKDNIELQLFALVGKKADDNKLNFNKNQKHKIGIFDNVDTDMSAGLKAVISRKKK